MSTIGHPLSDLINLSTPYSLANITDQMHDLSAFKEGATPGLPTHKQLVGWYAEIAGWDPTPDLRWGVAFHFFRAFAIYQGIAARYAVRQASSTKAKHHAAQRHPMGKLAWKLVQEARSVANERAKL